MTDIIADIFLVMALGWLFRKYRLVEENAEKVFNQYLYYAALPSLTLVKIADTSFAGLGADFIALNFLPLACLMGLIYLGRKAGLFDPRFARLMMITAGLGNTVYLGFPIVALSLGERYIGYAAIVASLQNLFIFTFGFYFMSAVCRDGCPASDFKRLVLKNVILWSSAAGLALSLSGIKIPGLIHSIMADIGGTTLPLALFTIGMSLYGKRITGNAGKVFWLSAFKMLLLPAIYMALALLFGFRGVISKVIFLQFAMPAAVLNYVIAGEFGFDSELVSQTIVLSTFLLLPLLFLLDAAMRKFL